MRARVTERTDRRGYPLAGKRLCPAHSRISASRKTKKTHAPKSAGRRPRTKERVEAELRSPRQRMEEVCGFLSASRSNTKSQILPDLPRRLEPPRQRVARRGSRITQKNIQQPAYPRRCRCGLNGGSPRCRCGFLSASRSKSRIPNPS